MIPGSIFVVYKYVYLPFGRRLVTVFLCVVVYGGIIGHGGFILITITYTARHIGTFGAILLNVLCGLVPVFAVMYEIGQKRWLREDSNIEK